MATLISPGIDVTVTDESYYATAGEGTVPLIIIGTHEYKTHPNGQEIAVGTLPENANKLYLITSQRELIQNFGNPVFYSSGGASRHAYELNEYGLHAAYQYLGIANRAFIIRGDVDYSQLFPRLSSPRGEPISGTYWLDTRTTNWGLFVSNGGSVPGSAWNSRTPLVIDQQAEVEHYVIGSVEFDNPTSVPAIASAGSIVLNGNSVALAANDTLQAVVNKINGANIAGIRAALSQLGGKSSLLLRNPLSNGVVAIDNTSSTSVLQDLGLSGNQSSYFAPKAVVGLDEDLAVVVTVTNENEVYQKLKAGGIATVNDPLSSAMWYRVGSDAWKAATPTRSLGRNNPVLTGLGNKSITFAVNDNPASAIIVTTAAGTNTIQALVDELNAHFDAIRALPSTDSNYIGPNDPRHATLWDLSFHKNGDAFEIVNRRGNDVITTSTSTVLVDLGIRNIVRGNRLHYAAHHSIPAGSAAGDIWVKTTEYDAGASWTLKVYNGTSGTWNTVVAPLYANDAEADSVFAAGRGIGVIYVRYNTLGTAGAPIASHQIRRWNGAAWEALAYNFGPVEPTTDPEEGTKWFNDNFRVDIMVADGDQWKGYKNYPGNIGTDANGPILAGSAPTTQLNGNPLAQNDLWINTSDTENYPKMYRFQALTRSWEVINTKDNTSPFGVVFADARGNADGLAGGAEDMPSMLISDYVDPDAPDPRLYPDGILLFNTRYATNNVKEWRPNYFRNEFGGVDFTLEGYNVGASNFPALAESGRWVTVSGKNIDGTPAMGRKAQRSVIVRALASTIASNEDIRAETIYFNLLAAPGYVELIDEMVTLNTDKKEVAFIVGDTPARLQPNGTAIQRWSNPDLSGVASNSEDGVVTRNAYVGMYYPWGLSTNVDGTEVMIPPATIGLRTLAYNDTVAYPWMPPAGFTRGLVTNATTVGYLDAENEFRAVMLNQGQRDVLYSNNLNPIAYVPNRGLVVYGQKTRHNLNTALDRINVARLINYMRYNLDNLAKPFLFELNHQHTRDAVRIVFERFLGNLVTLGGLYDYIVVCDTSNNTPDRIDRNELWIDVAIQPAKAIEFIYIPIRIVDTGEDMQSIYAPRNIGN